MRKQIIWLSMFFWCIAFSQNLMAQVKKVTVTGTIIDAVTKEPLTGATVSMPGKGLAQADINGKYTVIVDEGTTLTFSFVSYTPKTAKAAASLNITLQPESKVMQETVIRGYVKRTREQTTGASYIVTGKEVQDNPVGNVEQLLQGKVAGLNIQNNTGAPGMRGSVNIRGLSTIATTGSGDNTFLQPTSPLYIIDGVPLDADQASQFGFDQQGPGVSPLSLIPQEDIASMEILKDATATALYGSRGAYGVILIQTVRGRSKIPRITYTSNFVVNDVPKLREVYGGMAERNFKLAQVNAYGFGDDRYRISNTPFLSDSLSAFYNNSTNWQGIFYNPRFDMTHNVALDGGDPRFNYKVNLKYYSQTGIVENTGFENYSMNMNMEFKPSNKLSFFGQIRTALGKIKTGSGTGVLQRIVDGSGQRSTLLPGPSFLLATSDVLSTLQIRESSGPKNISTTINATYELLPGLSIATNGNYDYQVDNQDRFLPAAANSQFAQILNFYGYTSSLYNRNNVSYTKTVNKDHNFFMNVFSEVYIKKRQQSTTRIERTPNDQFEGPLGYDGNLSKGGGVLSTFYNLKTAAFAAQFTYDYKKKYILDLIYRLDGSSANGQLDPYSKNPSVGFKWNIHKENWVANNTAKWLEYADLRLTAGQNIYPVGTLQDIYGQYNPNGFYNNQARVGIDYEKIPNPYLKAKKVIQYNIGFDAGFLNGKLDMTFDTYYRGISNELFENRLSNTLAFDKYTSNGASFANYGYELSLTTRPLSKSAKLQWTFSVNGALNYNVLTKLPEQYNNQFIDITDPTTKTINVGGQTITVLDQPGQLIAKRVGRSALANYLFVNNGVYASTANVPVDPVTGFRMRNLSTNNTNFSYKGGDAMMYDANGDYVIDFRDRQVTGNTQPLLTGGISNTLNYGQWFMNIYASYTAVRSVLNNALAKRLLQLADPFAVYYNNGNPQAVPPAANLNFWKGNGDANAVYANIYDYTHEIYVENYRVEQSLFQENGSYLKLNQVTVGWSFPKPLAKRLGLNSVRTYFSASNLAVFSPYSGPNPENVNELGRDMSGGYPNPRQYTLGFNVQF